MKRTGRVLIMVLVVAGGAFALWHAWPPLRPGMAPDDAFLSIGQTATMLLSALAIAVAVLWLVVELVVWVVIRCRHRRSVPDADGNWTAER